MRSRSDHNLVIGVAGGWWLAQLAQFVAPAKAFQYGCAAQCDERDGFPYAAAMEWRKAAGLFAPKTRAAEYCWQRWERIMHLPRRLAGPIAASKAIVCSSKPATRPGIERGMGQDVFRAA